MKILIQLLIILIFTQTALAQSDTLRFDKNGKLEGIGQSSFLKEGDTVFIDLQKITVPKTNFVFSVNKLVDRLEYGTQETKLNCWYTEINDATFTQTTKIDSNAVLAYSPRNKYTPFEILDDTGIQKYIQVLDSKHVKANPVVISADGKLTNYMIIRDKLDNQIINKHLAATKNLYKGFPKESAILLDSLEQVYNNYFGKIKYFLYLDSLENNWGPESSVFNYKVVNEMARIYPRFSQINSLYNSTLDQNKEWIKSWLWLCNGEPRLNPFPVFDPEPLIRKTEFRTQITESKLALLKEYSGCCTAVTMQYDSAWLKMKVLTDEITRLKTKKDEAAALIPLYKNWVLSVSQPSETLYNGKLVGSGSSTIRWVYHYDASDKFKLTNSPSKLPEMVWMKDEVVVLIDNIKAGDSLSLKSSELAFQPKTKFETIAEPFSEGIAAAFKVGSPVGLVSALRALVVKPNGKNEQVGNNNLKNNVKVEKFLKANSVESINLSNREKISKLLQTTMEKDRKDTVLIHYLQGILTVNKAGFVKFLYDNYAIVDTAAYSELVTNFSKSEGQISWLLSQTQPVLTLKENKGQPANFSTQVEYPERKLEMETSKKVSYELFLNANKESELKKTYKKYTTSRWQPTVGITYVVGDRSGAVFNDSTGTFKSGQDFDNFEVLAGVKYYILKSNQSRDPATSKLIRSMGKESNVIRGNSFLSSVFATAGFGVRHKLLRNYYAGIGGDITPGLSFIVGSNFIFQKRYALENSTIKNSIERPKAFLFLGLSIDPVIVTSLISIFK